MLALVQIQFIAPIALFLLLFNSTALLLPIQSSQKSPTTPASERGAKKKEPSKMVRRLPSYTTALTTLFSYGLLFAFGQLRDFFRNLLDCFKRSNDDVKVVACSFSCSPISEVVGSSLIPALPFMQGYAPICVGLEDFFVRRLYLRVQVRVRRMHRISLLNP